MAKIEEYKKYIYEQYITDKWTLFDIYTLKPNSSNSAWNAAVKAAKKWAKEQIVKENKLPYIVASNSSNKNKLRKINSSKDPEIIRAILNVDSRIKPGSRPKDFKRSRPPTYMGKKLY